VTTPKIEVTTPKIEVTTPKIEVTTPIIVEVTTTLKEETTSTQAVPGSESSSYYALVLDDPDLDSMLNCHVGDSDVQQHVMWYLNQLQFKHDILDPGETVSQLNLYSLPPHDGELTIQCRSADPYNPDNIRTSKEIAYI